MAGTKDVDAPQNVVDQRLDQIAGVINAITLTYDSKGGEFEMTGPWLSRALWAAERLLDEAREAMDSWIDEDQANSRKKQ